MPEGFHDFHPPGVPIINSIADEPVTDHERQILISRSNDAVDLNSWHSCIGYVIAHRAHEREIFPLDARYDFTTPDHITIAKVHARRAQWFMLEDLRQNPCKVEEAWSWFQLGAELPGLREYYKLVDAELPTFEELDNRIEQARRRLEKWS